MYIITQTTENLKGRHRLILASKFTDEGYKVVSSRESQRIIVYCKGFDEAHYILNQMEEKVRLWSSRAYRLVNSNNDKVLNNDIQL